MDFGQISFNLVKNAFATPQLAVLTTSITFCEIPARACAEIKIWSFWRKKWPMSLGFSNFEFFFAFPFSILPFSFLFAVVIGLLLGLLSVKKLPRKRHRDRQISTVEQPGVVAGNFALSFSLNFLSIFVHISGSTRPIALIWASLERCFPPAEVEYRWCQFWSKGMTSEVKERPRLITAGYGQHRSQWVKI